MAEQHTPGPWMIGLGGGGHRHSHTIQQKVAGTQSAVIATIDTIIGPGGHDEGEANLYLIAAAPDLLATLREAQPHVCSLRCPSKWQTTETQPHSDECKRISAAIALTTGE